MVRMVKANNGKQAKIRSQPFFPLNRLSSGMPSCRYWSNCIFTSSGVALCFLTIALPSSYKLLRAPCSDSAKEEFERHRRASMTPSGSLRNWDFESTQIEYLAIGKRRWLISWKRIEHQNGSQFMTRRIHPTKITSAAIIEMEIFARQTHSSCYIVQRDNEDNPQDEYLKQNVEASTNISDIKTMKARVPTLGIFPFNRWSVKGRSLTRMILQRPIMRSSPILLPSSCWAERVTSSQNAT